MSATTPQIGVTIQNDSGALIPPRAVVIVTSVDIRTFGSGQENVAVHHVTKYNASTTPGTVLVTGPASIRIGGFGKAYSDQFIYVAIDQSIAAPKSGEQWGPVPNQWYISRGGVGFFAQGHPASNGDPTKSMFRRDRDRFYWVKLTSDLGAGGFTCPSICTANVWVPEAGTISWPKPLIEAPDPSLLGITLVNRVGSITASRGDVARIAWDDAAAEWNPIVIGKDGVCATSSSSASTSSSSGSSGLSGSGSTSGPCGCVTVVTGVSCSGGSISVTYGSARGCC